MQGLFRWHRRLGLLAALAVISGTLSGVLHTGMAAFQPKPVTFDAASPLVHSGKVLPVAPLLQQQGIAQVAELDVLQWQDRLWYQARMPGATQRLYFDAISGERLPNGDQRYAEHLARAYLGEQQARITDARLITSFDDEYPRVNRLLPVWRIAFDRPDAMRVYVDTGNGRLATLVNRTKAIAATQFSLLHRWSWLDSAPWLKLVLMSMTLLAALAVTLLGVYLYALRWRRTARELGLRRVHRVSGIVLSAAALAFASSGLYHLWQGELRGDPAQRLHAPAASFPVSALTGNPLSILSEPVPPVRRITLVAVADQAYWRFAPAMGGAPHGAHAAHHAKADGSKVKPSPGARYFSAVDLQSREGAETLQARALAQSVAPGATIVDVMPVTQFRGEYGFIFKRLPVQRITLDDGRALYADTADGVIAAVIDDGDRVEGWVFAYIHKMDWLAPLLGKGGRDIVVASVSALLLLFVLVGLVLYARQRRAVT